MEYRVRIYTLLPDRSDEFVDLWRRDVVPLRQAMGFDVLGGALVEDGTEFRWVLGWDGSEDYDVAEKRYFESPGRRALSWDARDYLVDWRVERISRLELFPVPAE